MITVQQADAGERADVVLGRRIAEVSRRAARKLGLRGHLFIDGQRAAPSVRVAAGQLVELRIACADPDEAHPAVEILAVTESFVYVDKPARLHTHKLRPGDPWTAADAVAREFPECAAVEPVLEGGAIHRLDRDTTGVLGFARTQAARSRARAAFSKGEVRKFYFAVSRRPSSWPPTSPFCAPSDLPLPTVPPLAAIAPVRAQALEIAAPLGRASAETVRVASDGLSARSIVWPLRWTPKHMLCLIELVTGRRHQARVHLAWVGAPIVGDARYDRVGKSPLFLHSLGLDLSGAIEGESPIWAPLHAPWDDLSAAD